MRANVFLAVPVWEDYGLHESKQIHVLLITAVFNNMQTLKFKPPSKNAFPIIADSDWRSTRIRKQTWFANMDLLCGGEWCFCM